MGREGERRDRARVRRGFNRGYLFLVLTDSPQSTYVFLAIATDHVNIKLILGRLQIMELTEMIFLEEVFATNGFWCYHFYSNNHEVFHIFGKLDLFISGTNLVYIHEID
jgi:hypothetical protein